MTGSSVLALLPAQTLPGGNGASGLLPSATSATSNECSPSVALTCSRRERRVLTAALKVFKGRRGKPTEGDRPPPSLFPMTPAARAAIEMRERQGRIEP